MCVKISIFNFTAFTVKCIINSLIYTVIFTPGLRHSKDQLAYGHSTRDL